MVYRNVTKKIKIIIIFKRLFVWNTYFRMYIFINLCVHEFYNKHILVQLIPLLKYTDMEEISLDFLCFIHT